MKKLVTVAITNGDDKFDYYESEIGLWTAIKALISIWVKGHGSINITTEE